MAHEMKVIETSPSGSCCSGGYFTGSFWTGVVFASLCAGLVAVAFIGGRVSAQRSSDRMESAVGHQLPSELLSATATHGGTNLAVCTAPVDEDSEGFFALDFKTGDLTGWVYYPRMGTFGAKFQTNVSGIFGQSKNPEFLLVSGAASPPPSSGGNVKPAASLIYVVDTRSGQFAAFTIPWNRSVESAGAPQGGQFIPVGGDQIRGADAGGGARKAPVAPAGPANAKPNNQPGNNADPNAADPNAVNPNNPNKRNPR